MRTTRRTRAVAVAAASRTHAVRTAASQVTRAIVALTTDCIRVSDVHGQRALRKQPPARCAVWLPLAQNEPAVGATVSARNRCHGVDSIKCLTNDNGFYALLGLVAGDYEIVAKRIVGAEAVTRRQTVQIGANVDG